MRHGRTFAFAAITVLLTSPSTAQEQLPGRFQLQNVAEDSYVILDTQTGRLQQCSQRAGKLACETVVPGVEDRAAQDGLPARIDTLEARIAALEAARPAAGLPSEEEFEQGLSYMERFFRRFMDIVSELDRNSGDSERENAPADRT